MVSAFESVIEIGLDLTPEAWAEKVGKTAAEDAMKAAVKGAKVCGIILKYQRCSRGSATITNCFKLRPDELICTQSFKENGGKAEDVFTNWIGDACGIPSCEYSNGFPYSSQASNVKCVDC